MAIHFFAMIDYAKENMQKIQEAEALENEQVQSSIALMFSQVQTHFLYNTLAAINQLCDLDSRQEKALSRPFQVIRATIRIHSP